MFTGIKYVAAVQAVALAAQSDDGQPRQQGFVAALQLRMNADGNGKHSPDNVVNFADATVEHSSSESDADVDDDGTPSKFGHAKSLSGLRRVPGNKALLSGEHAAAETAATDTDRKSSEREKSRSLLQRVAGWRLGGNAAADSPAQSGGSDHDPQGVDSGKFLRGAKTVARKATQGLTKALWYNQKKGCSRGLPYPTQVPALLARMLTMPVEESLWEKLDDTTSQLYTNDNTAVEQEQGTGVADKLRKARQGAQNLSAANRAGDTWADKLMATFVAS